MNNVTYVNPEIKSSYYPNNLGRVIYDLIIEMNAKTIVDVGILHGYSTVCMAQAAKKTGGHVYAYDIFEDYKYNNSTQDIVAKNLEKYNVKDYVTVEHMSLEDWVDTGQKFDILHVDISNTGDTIDYLYKKFYNCISNECKVLFEGGSPERDICEWMVKYNMKKINDCNVPFNVLSSKVFTGKGNKLYYPSVSELAVI